jgi:tetratricopeptide (TPR) repeat protein
VLYWFYDQGNRRKALPYAERLAELLARVAADHAAILGEECWSLVHELKGDLTAAITARENQIRLIRRLWEASKQSPVREAALAGYGPADLSDRLDLLAILYRDAGRLEEALAALQESKRVSEAAGVPFDGADLLEEFQAEKEAGRVVRAG